MARNEFEIPIINMRQFNRW